jgi:hypothetical protein
VLTTSPIYIISFALPQPELHIALHDIAPQ